jgi:hypothetical protein
MYPNEGPPKWNGITMWRGVTVGKPFLTGRTMIMAGYFYRRVVVYPISKRHEDGGEALINWVAEHRTAEDQPMPRQDWQHTATADEAVAPFATFTFDFLDVPTMIRRANAIYRYPMVDRDPLPTWNFGRITLLGDAAHPMYPVGSNGASQAIIDARVLARELACSRRRSWQSPPTMPNVVPPRRRSCRRTGRGPEQCMEIVEQRAPDGFSDLDAIISPQELAAISDRYKRRRVSIPRPEQQALVVCDQGSSMTTAKTTFLNEPIWRGKVFSGGWRTSVGGSQAVVEPATRTGLSEIGLATPLDLADAAALAATAQPQWAAMPYEERGAIFRKAARLFEEHAEEVVDWIVRETGSIAPKAEVEVRAAAGILNLSAAMITEPQGLVLPSNGGRISLARRIPLGVVGVISPFNFP